jgi:ABC-2 type transport system ATP-binding protein
MTAVLAARELGKKYRHRWALSDCTLSIPSGRVAGLVGPNGAGKTTLLHLATGMAAPSAGSIEVAGAVPASSPSQLASVGFVAQDAPAYAGLSVGEHLRLGARLNPSWDDRLASGRIAELGLNPRQKAGQLSGGERAQLALTMALAKRPAFLILDEPAASLDPLARREFLQHLAAAVADQQLSVHLVGDLERVCDYLIVLVASRVQLAGEVDWLLATHHRLTGPRRDPAGPWPDTWHVVSESHADRQTTLLVRTEALIRDPVWTVGPVSLEDLVLAYMNPVTAARGRRPALEATK